MSLDSKNLQLIINHYLIYLILPKVSKTINLLFFSKQIFFYIFKEELSSNPELISKLLPSWQKNEN